MSVLLVPISELIPPGELETTFTARANLLEREILFLDFFA
jgi:hypothetical protein